MEIGPNPKSHEFIPYPSFHYYEDLFWHADIVLGLVIILTFLKQHDVWKQSFMLR